MPTMQAGWWKNVRVFDAHTRKLTPAWVHWNGRQADSLCFEESGTDGIVHEGAHLVLSPAFTDLGTHLPDPGYEWRDTLPNLAQSARAGGYGTLVCYANSQPVLDRADALLAVQQRSQNLGVDFRFMGALTLASQGKLMAPLDELHRAGAVAFADGLTDHGDPSLQLRLMQYLSMFDGLMLLCPQDPSLTAGGQANESEATVRLGMGGLPNLAEELAVARCIQLLEEQGGRMHLAPITTQKAVQMVAQAQQRGLKLTASTTPHHLFFTDETLASFDTNYKVFPPLRTAADQEALVQGLVNGTLACISSQHQPLAVEDKQLEFEQAEPGVLALETAFAALHTRLVLSGKMDLERLLDVLANGARRVLNLPPLPRPTAAFSPNQWVLLDLERSWVVDRSRLHSRCSNSPFLGMHLSGQVLG